MNSKVCTIFTSLKPSLWRVLLVVTMFSAFFDLRAQTHLGVLHTQEELDIWRQRAAGTTGANYNVFGDVSTNSPRDWNRIVINAQDFYSGLKTNGNDPDNDTLPSTFVLGYKFEPHEEGIKLRDAAFYSLIINNTDPEKSVLYAKKVKQVLLARSRDSRTKFEDSQKYDVATFGDGKGYVLAWYMCRHAIAYDYIRLTLNTTDFTTSERTELNTWFENCANFYARNLHGNAQQGWLAGPFPNRLAENYTVKGYPASGPVMAAPAAKTSTYTHENAAGVPQNALALVGNYYNNRRSAHAAAVGLIDALLTKIGHASNKVYDKPLSFHAQLYVKEWLKYSVFPDGMTNEYQRGHAKAYYAGYNYNTVNLFTASLLAEVYARQGNDSLYKYSTSDGIANTQGGNKSIRMAVETHLGLIDGSIVRYFDSATPSTKYNNVQIDTAGKLRHYINDIWFSLSNNYWKSAYIKGVYTRKGPGSLPYPVEAITGTSGAVATYGGDGHIFPGMMFQYGQMENTLGNPYNPRPSITLTAPSNNATYTQGASITLNATAATSGGASITKVEFYRGSVKLGEDFTSPYSIPWSNATRGVHAITAKAIDNLGIVVTSNTSNITVNGSGAVAPTVAITSPTAGTLSLGTPIVINATAADLDGTIKRVVFYVGGVQVGVDSVSAYSASWSPTEIGTYSLTAVATDNLNTVTTSEAVSINISKRYEAEASVVVVSNGISKVTNDPLIFNASGNGYIKGYNNPTSVVTIGSTAKFTVTTPAAGSYKVIARYAQFKSNTPSVRTLSIFLNNATVKTKQTSFPCTYDYSSWMDAAEVLTLNSGTNTIAYTFDSTDNGGLNLDYIELVPSNNAPTVSITAPSNNTTVQVGSNIVITATATDNGSIKKVEFFQANTTNKLGEATTAPYTFTLANATAGIYSFTAKATDNLGEYTISSPIVVYVSKKYEAEQAVIVGPSGGANSNHLNYSGTGFVDIFRTAGSSYNSFNTVNVAQSGKYRITARYSNGAAGASTKTLSLYVNDTITKVKQISLPATANWDTWANRIDTVNLQSGINLIRYKYDTGDLGNINLDYILVESNAAASTARLGTVKNELELTGAIHSLKVHPNPLADQATIEFSTPETDYVSLDLYDAQGALIGKLYEGISEAGVVNSVKLNGSTLKNGVYIVRLVTSKKANAIKLVITK